MFQLVKEETGLQKHKTSHAVECLLKIMKDTLTSGEDVLISGFGKLYPVCKIVLPVVSSPLQSGIPDVYPGNPLQPRRPRKIQVPRGHAPWGP
ncbi:MAG: HU family DNA-binding protein [Deltaproteobacteria bacterium]|nr:HU family DNA-binding protein [Deltaproteobacteria bacterium]